MAPLTRLGRADAGAGLALVTSCAPVPVPRRSSRRSTNLEALAGTGYEVVLEPREQKDVYPVPQQVGHFQLTCADHDAFGTTGDILVD
jgi:hypothetical protein